MQKPRTVLVVDDDSMMRNMPKMGGLQALEEIHKKTPTARVMMVSADATMDRVQEAILLGAAGFVVKPLNAASVLDRIDKCFKGRTSQ